MNNFNNSFQISNTTEVPPEAVTELCIVYSIGFFIIVLAIFFHVLGITLLWKTKTRDISNQSMFLIQLSIASFPSIVLNAIAIHHKANRMFFPNGFIVCYNISHMSYILSLIYLASDRLLFVLLTLKYRIYITRLVVIIALIILWCISISYGVMLEFASLVNHNWYVKYASYIYNGSVIIFTSFAYISIIIKVIISSRNITSNQGNGRAKIRKYAVPFCIVMTFFLFVFLPSLIANEILPHVSKYYRRTFLIGLIGFNVLNNIFDPVIYIFLQPKIRKKLKKRLAHIGTSAKKDIVDKVIYRRRVSRKETDCTNTYSTSSLVNI